MDIGTVGRVVEEECNLIMKGRLIFCFMLGSRCSCRERVQVKLGMYQVLHEQLIGIDSPWVVIMLESQFRNQRLVLKAVVAMLNLNEHLTSCAQISGRRGSFVRTYKICSKHAR